MNDTLKPCPHCFCVVEPDWSGCLEIAGSTLQSFSVQCPNCTSDIEDGLYLNITVDTSNPKYNGFANIRVWNTYAGIIAHGQSADENLFILPTQSCPYCGQPITFNYNTTSNTIIASVHCQNCSSDYRKSEFTGLYFCLADALLTPNFHLAVHSAWNAYSLEIQKLRQK